MEILRKKKNCDKVFGNFSSLLEKVEICLAKTLKTTLPPPIRHYVFYILGGNNPNHKEHLVAALSEMFPQSGAFRVKIITPHLLLFVTTVPVPFPACLLFKAAGLIFDTCL